MDPITFARLWIAVRPWHRLKEARNRRRARLGKPLLPITGDDDMVFPKGTMTKAGAGIAVLGPVIAVGLQQFGVGECTTEQLVDGCVGASQYAGIAVTVLGALISWIGRNRAAKHAAEAVAAATKPAA